LGRIDVTLCAILGEDIEALLPLETFTNDIIDGGVTCLQVRCKQADTRGLLELAGRVVQVASGRGIPVIVNDRVDVAMAVGAQGVHLGERDLPLAQARGICGPKLIIGVTVRDARCAMIAEEQGADYVGVGPVFATSTKPELVPIGPAVLEAISKQISLPILAIGGINEENVAIPVEQGATGVAVVSALRQCRNPKEVASRLRNAIDQAKKR
jgi:thiamine-phosphate pyrophosphorylase